MALVRVPKGNFTTIENSLFKDGRISLKAKGLFCYMISKKDGWSFSAERISNENNDGRDGVRAGLRELEENGYLTRVRVNSGGGLFSTEYHLSYPESTKETPTDDGLTDDGKTVDGKTNDGLTDDGKAVYNNKDYYSKYYINNTINNKEKENKIDYVENEFSIDRHFENSNQKNDVSITIYPQEQKEKSCAKKEKVNHESIVSMYHSICKSFPKVLKLTKSRKTKIENRISEMGNDLGLLHIVFQKMEESSFLRGENKNGWKASFDWIFENDKNWIKVVEGNYESKSTEQTNKKSIDQIMADVILKKAEDGRYN